MKYKQHYKKKAVYYLLTPLSNSVKVLTVFALAAFVTGCTFSFEEKTIKPAEESPKTSQPRVNYMPIQPDKELKVGFLMIDGVFNSELMAPYDVFHHTAFREGIKPMRVFTVAPTMDPVTSFEGLKLIPDYTFENAPEIDVFVVPSAEHNLDTDLENEALISFVKTKGEKAQYIMSLCDGAFVLGKAGLLDGLNATTFPGDIEPFRKMFGQIKVHENVSFIHDGKAITSAGGAKSYDAALYLVERLYGRQHAIEDASGICIDWDLSTIKHKVFE
jgi:transcriptional regulator GlxA family with amidase domain